MKPGRSWLSESRGSLAASFAASVTLHAAVLALYGCMFVSPARYGISTTTPDQSGSILNIICTEPVTSPAMATDAKPAEAVAAPPLPSRDLPPLPAPVDLLPEEPADSTPPAPVPVVAAASPLGERNRSAADEPPSSAPPSVSPGPASGAPAGVIPTAQLALDRARPDYLCNPHPVYPPAARRAGLQGTVLLEVRLDERGTVTELSVKRSSGHAVLDRAAATSVGRWRFLPARIGPVPVGSTVEIPVRFELD